jgi:hypothetical protein
MGNDQRLPEGGAADKFGFAVSMRAHEYRDRNQITRPTNHPGQNRASPRANEHQYLVLASDDIRRT